LRRRQNIKYIGTLYPHTKKGEEPAAQGPHHTRHPAHSGQANSGRHAAPPEQDHPEHAPHLARPARVEPQRQVARAPDQGDREAGDRGGRDGRFGGQVQTLQAHAGRDRGVPCQLPGPLFNLLFRV